MCGGRSPREVEIVVLDIRQGLPHWWAMRRSVHALSRDGTALALLSNVDGFLSRWRMYDLASGFGVPHGHVEAYPR